MKLRKLRKPTHKILGLLILFLMAGSINRERAAADSYQYSIWDKDIPVPDAYQWERSIRAADLGIPAISNISDVFYTDGRIYIAMTGSIVITDEELNTVRILDSYERSGKDVKVQAPKCVFVTKEGDIYFTEQDMGEIIHLNSEGDFIRALSDPKIAGLENVKYAPAKVVVDTNGRIYVKAKSIYEGIIELNPNGTFNRFVGANEVHPSFLDIFYRMIATEEQISRMALWLPTDYRDIALDKDGFLLATVKDNTSTNPVRKLNSKGEDILETYEFINPPMGDYTGNRTISTLTNIAAAEDGRFAVLDASMSRVFVYSEDGLLAYILGGSGKREGNLSSPVDVVFMGDKIMIADLVTCSIEVFVPTEYGALINEGLRQQSVFDYEKAAKYWYQAYELNPYSLVVNMELGKYQLRAGDYEGALVSFKETGERKNYSAAYEMIRAEYLEDHMWSILLGVIIFFLIIGVIKAILKRLKKKGVLENKKYIDVLRSLRSTCFRWPGYMLSHPFKAFDDVKYENAGSLTFAWVILILFAFMQFINTRYTGFLLNMADINNINIPLILISSVFPYLVFIIANWAVGVLIDGKGTLVNIFKINMYALYPGIYITLFAILVSRVSIYEEIGIIRFFYVLPFVFYLFYTFIGLIMVHQFSFSKALVSIVLSLVAMVIIIFIAVLLLTLISGFINDVGTIIDEFLLYA